MCLQFMCDFGRNLLIVSFLLDYSGSNTCRTNINYMHNQILINIICLETVYSYFVGIDTGGVCKNVSPHLRPQIFFCLWKGEQNTAN